jgi:hypothetical protein
MLKTGISLLPTFRRSARLNILKFKNISAISLGITIQPYGKLYTVTRGLREIRS